MPIDTEKFDDLLHRIEMFEFEMMDRCDIANHRFDNLEQTVREKAEEVDALKQRIVFAEAYSTRADVMTHSLSQKMDEIIDMLKAQYRESDADAKKRLTQFLFGAD